MFFKETESSNLVGKLEKIIPEGGQNDHPKWPMIEVSWYYRKQDLDYLKLGISTEDLSYISDNELFPTPHTDKIYVDSINGRVKIYSIFEYDKLSLSEHSAFFVRADYDPQKKVLNPKF